MIERCITVAVGKDSNLLDTRQMVIERAGSASRRAFSVLEVDHALSRKRIRAVVLCYTLTEDERNDIRAMAEDKDPHIVIVEVSRAEHSASELFETISFVAMTV